MADRRLRRETGKLGQWVSILLSMCCVPVVCGELDWSGELSSIAGSTSGGEWTVN